MTYLLDVNVLIALIDSAHVNHDLAHRWFVDARKEGWATCPLVENGAVRIISQSSYPKSPGDPTLVIGSLRQMRDLPGYEFWPDDISLLDPNHVKADRILRPAQITDSYLLALARSQNGQLATFDKRLSTIAVEEGERSLYHIPIL